MPILRGQFSFFRDVRTDDLWAICDFQACSFGVQLDPDCEVICLWNAETREEIGDWPPQIPNPVEYTIRAISERYLYITK